MSLPVFNPLVDGSKQIAAAVNNDLSYLMPIRYLTYYGVEFESEIYETIDKSVNDAFKGNYILTSFIGKEPQTEIPNDIGRVWTLKSKNDSELSHIQQQINEDYWLISRYQNEQFAAQRVMNFLLTIPKRITKELAIIVKALDILAGRNQPNQVAEELLNALKSLFSVIESIVSFAANIGFPEIPILGSLKDLIDEIIMANKIINDLPPEVQKELNEAQSKVDLGARLMDILDKDIARLINRAREDIEIIIKNIQWLPLTLLASLVVAILQALTKVFDTLHLDFNIDSFLPKLNLIPSFKLDMSMLEKLAPPGNILEAVLQAIAMIPVFVTNIQNIFANSIAGFLWKMTTGLRTFDTIFNAPDKVLSAAYINLISCQNVYSVVEKRGDLLQECLDLQKAFDQIERKEKQKELVQESLPKYKPQLREIRLEEAEREVKFANENYKALKKALSQKFKAGAEFIKSSDPQDKALLSIYTLQGKTAAQMIREDMQFQDDGENFDETADAINSFKGIRI